MYQFCIAVLRHEFSRPNWQPFVSLFWKINRLLEVLLGAGAVALILLSIYNYIPILNHKRWAAIIILAGLVLLGVWFLGAVKRFQEDTLAEVFKTQEERNSQLDWFDRRIEFLTLLLGRSDALYLLLDNRSWGDNENAGMSIAKSEIKYHEADIYNTLREHLGSEGVQDYFKKLGAVPDNLSAQVNRINAHRNKLHELLQSERAQLQEIVLKAMGHKRETLARIGTHGS